MQLLIEFGLK